MPLSMPKVIDPRDLTNAHLRCALGDYQMNIDGTTDPRRFAFTPGSQKRFLLISFNILIVDRSIDAGDFGGIPGGLSEGLRVLIVEHDRPLTDFSAGAVIRRNWDWSHLCGMDWKIDRGSRLNVLTAKLTLSGVFFATVLKPDHSIVVGVHDDLTSINRFEATVSGVYIDRI